ncbi:MAG: 4'-phosphopantetheinyl transferase superfamily protein [Clostridia bacterium]|nr:4'-phosphopantetheinyl transferase superfamily protein [Clostridia bacterium]
MVWHVLYSSSALCGQQCRRSFLGFNKLDNQRIIPDPFDMTRSCRYRADLAGQEVFARVLVPLFVDKSLFGDNHLTLVNLASLGCFLEDREQDVTALLSSSELQLFAGYSYAKRRLEWLGGRIAAKDALARLLGDASSAACRDLSVLPDSHGRPVVSTSLLLQWRPRLSLSHCKNYAVALACREEQCGVDIEFCSERLLTVRKRFTTDSEMALFAEAMPELSRLAILWTVKEAVKKCCFADQPTFFGRTRVCAVREGEGGRWWVDCCLDHEDRARNRVQVVRFDRYFLAWVTGGTHA